MCERGRVLNAARNRAVEDRFRRVKAGDEEVRLRAQRQEWGRQEASRKEREG